MHQCNALLMHFCTESLYCAWRLAHPTYCVSGLPLSCTEASTLLPMLTCCMPGVLELLNGYNIASNAYNAICQECSSCSMASTLLAMLTMLNARSAQAAQWLQH
eukprot:816921-Pelagomonas_calceolata.AAC.4